MTRPAKTSGLAELEQPVDCAECGARVRVKDSFCPECDANVCRVCGCTDESPCVTLDRQGEPTGDTCAWVDETRRICTDCQPPQSRDT